MQELTQSIDMSSALYADKTASLLGNNARQPIISPKAEPSVNYLLMQFMAKYMLYTRCDEMQ